MYKIWNILMMLFIMFFIYSTFSIYNSNLLVNKKKFNRSNIDEILKEKVSDLPILENDTSDVVEFNDTFNMDINNKKRSFWKLFKD